MFIDMTSILKENVKNIFLISSLFLEYNILKLFSNL